VKGELSRALKASEASLAKSVEGSLANLMSPRSAVDVLNTTGVKGELSRALKANEASLAKSVEGSIKAAAKRAEEERRKAAAKERTELAAQLEKMMAAQLGQVRNQYF
jgi:hypothetical protein